MLLASRLEPNQSKYERRWLNISRVVVSEHMVTAQQPRYRFHSSFNRYDRYTSMRAPQPPVAPPRRRGKEKEKEKETGRHPPTTHSTSPPRLATDPPTPPLLLLPLPCQLVQATEHRAFVPRLPLPRHGSYVPLRGRGLVIRKPFLRLSVSAPLVDRSNHLAIAPDWPMGRPIDKLT